MGSLIKDLGYIEWLSKSNFSFLSGASHPEEILLEAEKFKYKAIALNDFDGLYGSARAYRSMRDKSLNLKLVTSAELHLRKDHHLPIFMQWTGIFLPLNKIGYLKLNQLIGLSHQGKKPFPYISPNDLSQEMVKNLVLILPMRGLVRDQSAHFVIAKLKEIFQSNLYFAFSRHLHPLEDCWSKEAFNLSKKFKTPRLISQDIFYHHRKLAPLSDLLLAIKSNKKLTEAQEFFFPNSERSLKPLLHIEKIYQKFPFYEQSLKTSCSLYEKIDFSFSELSYQYPKEMIPKNYSAQSFLSYLVKEGIKERYPQGVSLKTKNVIEKELLLIEELSFADYFLTVWDIVQWARKQKILCQGRGSAANSAVCFCLGITSADPENFDLLFERFISRERGEPPDIDVDFEHERREEVIQYIYQRYGRKRAAMLANVITYKKKGALRSVGKALGVDENILSLTSNICSSKYFRGHEISSVLSEVKNKTKADLPWKLWNYFSAKLKGFPRHLGIHSGGFILSDDSLDHLVPQEPATMEGRTVIQWSKEDVEGLGFFKIDILALGMLTALRKSFESIKEKTGHELALYNVPPDDTQTYQMIQKAETVGVFQIESRAQMSMLPRLRPRCFYDLVIEIAIIRPGPIQGKVIHPYLRRRNGVDPVQYPHPDLEPILKETLGVAIFQEQIMKIAIALGDFTPGEADELRKNIGSWNIASFERNLSPWINKLKSGMLRHGIKQEYIEQILGQMKGFAHYGFPESHSISFAFLAYASCYLKRHYPAFFFCSVLNSQPMGFYSPHALLGAAKRDGVKISPLCILSSQWDHKVIKTQSGLWGIRLGMRLICDLSKERWLQFEKIRQDFSPSSIEEIIGLKVFHLNDLNALASANSFFFFEKSRSQVLWKIQALPHYLIGDQDQEKVLFSAETEPEQMARDFRSFGTSLGRHPALLFKDKFWSYQTPASKVTDAKKLEVTENNTMVHVFGLILSRQAPPSAKGMVFLTLEDEGGFINLVFPPDVYSLYFEIIEKEQFLCAYGKAQKQGFYHSILVQSLSYHQTNLLELKKQKKNNRKKMQLSLIPRSYY